MLARLYCCAFLTLVPATAFAQVGGVSNSGMGQGEARISSRSDVRLSMESMPGTSGSSVSALGARVGRQMSTIRGCYTTVVAEDPSVAGTLRLRIQLPERGRADVDVDNDGVGNAGLVRCVTRALQAVDCDSLRRPTGAIVQLEMGNSAAQGARRAQRRAQEAQQVSVTMDGDNPTSTGGSAERGVRFTVTGTGRDSTPAVVAAHRALLTSLPGLMDCHRRASRRRQDPSGELSATVQVREGRRPTTRVTRSTVASTRARPCVARVLRGIERRSTGGTGRVAVTIQFAGGGETASP